MALTKIFKTKPYDSKGTTYVSEVIFSKQEINFDTLLMNNSKFYKIWSIELGVIYVDHKPNQSSVYCAILKTLKKLQKNGVPSHIIISEMVREDKKITNTYRIHRLTEDQELTIYQPPYNRGYLHQAGLEYYHPPRGFCWQHRLRQMLKF